jgi:ubiquinone/menaquinone biosynthesis C-methylase UbiE
MAAKSTIHLFDKYYYDRPDFVGGTRSFHELCASRIKAGSLILDIGAGPSNTTSDFLATLGTVWGVDMSKEVAGNRALASWKIFDGRKMPFEDNSFDFCVSDWVLEHVEEPARHFAEVNRILRPGGSYCFRTLNAFHYVGAISRFSPFWFHKAVTSRLRGLENETREPYPTFYRCNTLRAVHHTALKTGFSEATVKMLEAEPSYGRASPLLFYPMFLWERTVNATEILRFLRAGILGSVAKAQLS